MTFESTHEIIGELHPKLGCMDLALRPVPSRDPVDRSEDGEDRDLGIHIPKFTVFDALHDQVA